MCHVSRVMCQLPTVTCHLSHVKTIFFYFFFIEEEKINEKNKKNYLSQRIRQSGGVSRWRVCYQRGLPRLVLTDPM